MTRSNPITRELSCNDKQNRVESSNWSKYAEKNTALPAPKSRAKQIYPKRVPTLSKTSAKKRSKTFKPKNGMRTSVLGANAGSLEHFQAARLLCLAGRTGEGFRPTECFSFKKYQVKDTSLLALPFNTPAADLYHCKRKKRK